MAGNRACPHYSSRRAGKWTVVTCTLPPGRRCPTLHCRAHPLFAEAHPLFAEADDDECG